MSKEKGVRGFPDAIAGDSLQPGADADRVPPISRGEPGQESEDIGFTAAQANVKMTAIQSMELAASAAQSGKINAKRARDVAQRGLEKRMSGLRGELVQLLSREDGIWREFGFRRPADGRMPEDV